MKKMFLFAVFVLASSFGVQICAQLKVNDEGVVRLGTDTTYTQLTKPAAIVNKTGEYEYGLVSYLASDRDWGFALCGTSFFRHDRQVGVRGYASNAQSVYSGRSYGVMGIAGNCTSGYNYGVYGKLDGQNNGAGILGTTSDNVPSIPGMYAGYFYGSIYVTNALTASSITNLSDANLKSNISNIKSEYMQQVLTLNPVQYKWDNNKLRELYRNNDDTASVDLDDYVYATDDLHFGLLAQEVQQVFPQLVQSDDNGTLSINYIELIPLLLQSVKDLSAEVQELKANIAKQAKAPGLRSETNTSEQAVLYQNIPNPVDAETEIYCDIPSSATSATIYLYNTNGLQIADYVISHRGHTSVTISSDSLSAGIYMYSLVVDGKLIDTKQMILTK